MPPRSSSATKSTSSPAHPDRLTVEHHLDADSGFLTVEDVTAFVGRDTDAHVYVWGPTPFMDLVETWVAAAGKTC